jgi:hypothetical protein
MSLTIPERIPPHKLELAQLLDRQIKVLETGGDTKSVFDADDLEGIRRLGHAKYLAHLKEMRLKLGQPEDLSGD